MHCCTCSRVCYHVSPPSFCERHGGTTPSTPYPPTPTPSTPYPGPYAPPVVPQGGFTVVLTDVDIERIARKVVELLRGEVDIRPREE